MLNKINHYDAQSFLDCVYETSGSQHVENVKLSTIISSLKLLNFPQGCVVILLFPNCKDLLLHIFAVILSGYVPALVSPATPIVRLNILAEQLNAKAIIKPKIFKNSLSNILKIESLSNIDIVILNNKNEVDSRVGEFILTTSGSSDFSAGCVFDISALLRNAAKHATAIKLTTRDTILVNLPLFYSYAFVAQALAAYVNKCKLMISAPPFNCASYLHDMQKFNVSVSSITPLLVKELLSYGEVFPHCLRALTVGGDALGVNYTKELLTKNPSTEIYLTYGITEAGPRVSTLAAHLEPNEKLSSVGIPLVNTEVKLMPQTNELLIHSDTLVKRRLGAKEKPLFITDSEKNWLRTGDIFSIDADGYLYFKNRISDFIVLNGEKVNLSAIKKFVTDQHGVTSAKVSLIKDQTGLVGYDLNIIMQQCFEKNFDEVKQIIRKGLKIAERPKSIEISRFGESHVERYK